jgi:hypothetical protein
MSFQRNEIDEISLGSQFIYPGVQGVMKFHTSTQGFPVLLCVRRLVEGTLILSRSIA